MPKAAAVQFEPRKTPRQARSTASVEAILEATIQVLLVHGRAKLTTTRVAQRAGVSVGTLYQYFPNKSSLLQSLLKHHLDGVAAAVEVACHIAHGTPLAHMAEAVAAAFVHAKFSNIDEGAALYAVSDDVEGKRIAREMHLRVIAAMTAMLQTSPGAGVAQPELAAATILSAMAGVSRTVLENGVTPATMTDTQTQLTIMIRAYLEALHRRGHSPAICSRLDRHRS